MFTVTMGPAEITAWTLIGSVWDFLSDTFSGIEDAATIRVAHRLGSNSPYMAKITSYKAILIGSIYSVFTTSIFYLFMNEIPSWLTNDTTLQQMIRGVLPYLGLANIFASFGMICWSIIGSQGLWWLSTFVQTISSWMFLLPFASIMVYILHYNLKGLASAVVLSYVNTGLIMAVLVYRSDWVKLAQNAYDRALEEESDSESDSESSDSESSDDDSSTNS